VTRPPGDAFPPTPSIPDAEIRSSDEHQEKQWLS
jgi:hypothetical protein